MFEICENAILPLISSDIAQIRSTCSKLRQIGTKITLDLFTIYKKNSLARFEKLITSQPFLIIKEIHIIIDNYNWFYHLDEISEKTKQWLKSQKLVKFVLIVKNVNENLYNNLFVITNLIRYINTESFYLRWPKHIQNKIFSDIINIIVSSKKLISVFEFHLDNANKPGYCRDYDVIGKLIQFGYIRKIIMNNFSLIDNIIFNSIKTPIYCNTLITNQPFTNYLIAKLNNTIELRDRYKITYTGKFNELSF